MREQFSTVNKGDKRYSKAGQTQAPQFFFFIIIPFPYQYLEVSCKEGHLDVRKVKSGDQ